MKLTRNAFDLDWFEKEFKDKLGRRYMSQCIALNLLTQITATPFILETGTVRKPDDWSAGMSTCVYGAYIQKYGGNLTTVDILFENINISKEVTEEYKSLITYVVSDSLMYIPTVTKKIDLLYLDSFDCPSENEDAWKSQNHNLREFLLSEPLLNTRAIIMIDDIDIVNGGKARKTHEYLQKNGYLLVYKDKQSVWLK